MLKKLRLSFLPEQQVLQAILIKVFSKNLFFSVTVTSKSFSSQHSLNTKLEFALTKQTFYLLVEPDNKKEYIFMIT